MYPVILLKWSRLRFPVMQDLEFSQCIILHNDDCQVAVSYFVVILLKWSRLRFPVMQDLEFSQRNDFLHHPLLKLRIRFRNRPHRDAEVSATCYLSLPENEDCEKAWA
ncbi:hypothetical protein T12_11263 [Trichinella patagoniensis]|uniref:Uncharacterized protein n=1 Tax=Trichinella patagoniensis TaxID=990121 RepID=A0A0V0Z8N9_9BILA|nr:hypothetical protein T12_11263 [Trichinella patagoniensis]